MSELISQFDNEPINYIDPNRIYNLTLLDIRGNLISKNCHLIHKYTLILDDTQFEEYVKNNLQYIDIQNQIGLNALMIAVLNNYITKIEILLKYRANMYLTNQF